MFRFLKRVPSPAPKPDGRVSAAKPRASKAALGVPEPTPIPEVIEGNGDTDWTLWEQSVSFQDSQTASLGASTLPLGLREERSDNPKDDDDPFASVRKKRR